MNKIILLVLLIGTLGGIAGCATTKGDGGGSALPWSKPEPWENKMPGAPSMSY